MAQYINLYDPALERRRDWLALGSAVVAVAFAALTVALAGWLERSELPALTAQAERSEQQLKASRDQLATLGQQVAGRQADPRLAQEIAGKRQLLSLRGEVLAVLLANLGPQAPSYSEFMRGFARQSVPGLWLTGFALQADGGMEIKGATLETALLPEYIRRLNRESAFRGKTFAALKLDHAAAPATAAGGAAPAGEAAAAPPAVRAGWHEFLLVPERAADTPPAAAAGKREGGR